MTTKTKVVLGLVVIGGVAFYLINKSKKDKDAAATKTAAFANASGQKFFDPKSSTWK